MALRKLITGLLRGHDLVGRGWLLGWRHLLPFFFLFLAAKPLCEFGEGDAPVVLGAGVGVIGADALVVDVGPVGLEEEGEHAVAALGGALEGAHFEGFDEPVAGVAPGLGEIVVLVAPVVGGAGGDTGEMGGLFDGEAQLVGDEEGLLFLIYFRRGTYFRRGATSDGS